MTKLQKCFIVLIVASLILFLCAGVSVVTYAETDENLWAEELSPTDTPENADLSIDDVAVRFLAYLKEKYGADYEFYYNTIIENWGSIEGYLLAIGNTLPEAKQTDWEIFVGWLRDYAPVWAAPLALTLFIIAVLSGKKILNCAIERIVNSKLKPVAKELNSQSSAIVSIMHGQKALLGGVPKFSDNVKELDDAEKELTDG